MSTPIWISHRGYCEEATENTAEAFRAAQALGFRHLETDLRSTTDGHIVLAHDPDLLRLSGTSLLVEQSSRRVLEQNRLEGGEDLVFFDQFLSEFTPCHWIFDIKPESALRTLDTLLYWWRQPEHADFFHNRVRFLFWRKEHQDYLYLHRPDAVCMARLEHCRRAGLASLLGVPGLAGIEPGVSYALPPSLKGMNLMRPSVLARYRRCGAKVLAYLPGNRIETERALKVGADEILTNGPPLIY